MNSSYEGVLIVECWRRMMLCGLSAQLRDSCKPKASNGELRNGEAERRAGLVVEAPSRRVASTCAKPFSASTTPACESSQTALEVFELVDDSP
jgi:hypothetical protein